MSALYFYTWHTSSPLWKLWTDFKICALFCEARYLSFSSAMFWGFVYSAWWIPRYCIVTFKCWDILVAPSISYKRRWKVDAMLSQRAILIKRSRIRLASENQEKARVFVIADVRIFLTTCLQSWRNTQTRWSRLWTKERRSLPRRRRKRRRCCCECYPGKLW